MAANDIDPLDGINLEGAYVLKSQDARPDLHIVKGDRLIVQPADNAPAGALVVVKYQDGHAALVRWDGKIAASLIGLVVGVVRKVKTDV